MSNIPVTNYALETHAVVKKYQADAGTIFAVNEVSLQVSAGEFVALVGPSGSGKTTMLSMLAALLKPSSGQILLDGEDLAPWNGTLHLCRQSSEASRVHYGTAAIAERDRYSRKLPGDITKEVLWAFYLGQAAPFCVDQRRGRKRGSICLNDRFGDVPQTGE